MDSCIHKAKTRWLQQPVRPYTKDVVFTSKKREKVEESEKSYAVYSNLSYFLENYVFLYTEPTFMIISTFANVFLFGYETFKKVYDKDRAISKTPAILICITVGYLIIIVDIISSIMHRVCTSIASRKALMPRGIYEILADLIFQVLSFIFSHIVHHLIILTVGFEICRLFRVIIFFNMISKHPGNNSVIYILLKFCLLVFAIVHTSAVLTKLSESQDATRGWIENYNARGEPLWEYLYYVFAVLSAITNTGIIEATPQNDVEMFLLVVLMISGMLFIQGIFLGSCTSIRIEGYRMKAMFYDRLKMIEKHLDESNIPKKLGMNIMNYYREFWKQEHGARRSKLFAELPQSIKKTLLLDKYWNLFNQSNYLCNTHAGFKRSLAEKMFSRIVTTGELIYTQNVPKDVMMYLTKGTVQLLSAEDMESPLITLGVGTLFGESSMFCSASNPVQVIASSYCVIHCLAKADVFRISAQYRKLHQLSIIKAEHKKIMALAREKHAKLHQMHKRELSRSLEGIIKTLREETEVSAEHKMVPKFPYVLSEDFTIKNLEDEIFFKTTFPFVLQANSSLLLFWDLIIVITTMVVATMYPYYISFHLVRKYSFFFVSVYVQIFYLLDVVLQCMIVTEDGNGIHTKLSEIIIVKMTSIVFYMDIIAALPTDVILIALLHDIENSRVATLSFTRLLKLHKIIWLFSSLENSFKFNIALLRLFKYTLYIFFISYILGTVYYINACYAEECFAYSWVSRVKKIFTGISQARIFYNAFQSVFLLVMLAGGGVITFATKEEMVILIVVMMIGIVMFCFIAADYGATLTFVDYAKHEYRKTMMMVTRLINNEMYRDADIQRNLQRMYSYLSFQWGFNRGQSLKSLLAEAPTYMYETHQVAKYSKVFKNVALFSHVGEEFHDMMAKKAELVYFATNDVFVYANEEATAMYILRKGYCELISGKNATLQKCIGPGSVICAIEVLLGFNNMYFVRPTTNVVLLKVSRKDINIIVQFFPQFQEVINIHKKEFRDSVVANKVFHSDVVRLESVDYTQKMPSFFIFPSDKTEPLYQDLMLNWGEWKFLRYIMLPVTIMPQGDFIIICEIIYNINMLMLIILNMVTDIYRNTAHFLDVCVWTFETVQLISLYIRFHIGFYNSKGILVTHPRYTALNYLKNAFITDFVSMVPIGRLYRWFNYTEGKPLYLKAPFNCNRLLQLYRLPLLFYYFTRDEFNPTGITINVVKFLPVTLVFLFVCVTLLMTPSTKIYEKVEGVKIVPNKHSIIDFVLEHLREDFKDRSPEFVYLISVYYTVCITLQMGFSGIIPEHTVDVVINVVTILIGYLMFTYVLVVITNSLTTINSQLTMHQNHMQHVVKFMKYEKVPKNIQTNAIEYFELTWKQDHGTTADDILDKCHHVLCEDFLYDQYKTTFNKVTIFLNLASTMYRTLSLHLRRIHFLPDVSFIRLNDVVSKMYLVHSGEVKVYGPGNFITTLGRGALIGNIDNIKYRRSMVTFKTFGAVELLQIEAEEFYRIMSAGICMNLERHLKCVNLSYVAGVKTKLMQPIIKQEVKTLGTTETLSNEMLLTTNILTSKPLNMIFMLISFISILNCLYLLAFYDHDAIFHYLITYICDAMHFVILALKFITPYYDAKGQLVTSRKMIKYRLVRNPYFYINLFASIPFELLFLIPELNLVRNLILYRLSRLNRCLRIYNILKFFKEFSDILTSDLLTMKITFIAIASMLMLHVQTCILYLFASRGEDKLSVDSWAYQYDRNNGSLVPICDYEYLCCMYTTSSMLTMSGISIAVRTKGEMLYAILQTIFNKFLGSICVAELSACIQTYSVDLTEFDNKYMELHLYLKRSIVSKPLIDRTLDYCQQLWEKSKGVQKPVLLYNAQAYIKEDIKSTIYEKHINNNLVFAQCHRDFVRLLLKCLKVETFFKGDTICEQGDINETMYFIHQGSISVHYLTETEDIHVDQLEELDCFGMIQGLYPMTPHTHTFVATTVTVVLTLKRLDWYHALKFYPASKFHIYDKLFSL